MPGLRDSRDSVSNQRRENIILKGNGSRKSQKRISLSYHITASLCSEGPLSWSRLQDCNLLSSFVTLYQVIKTSILAFARINYFCKEACLASPRCSRQIRRDIASFETPNRAVYTGHYFGGIWGMGKGAKESSKAKLGGEPTPGRVRRAFLWRNTLKGVSAEQPLEPLRLYWLQITPLIAMLGSCQETQPNTSCGFPKSLGGLPVLFYRYLNMWLERRLVVKEQQCSGITSHKAIWSWKATNYSALNSLVTLEHLGMIKHTTKNKSSLCRGQNGIVMLQQCTH